ncbi:MAG: hypothetical protein KAG14_04245 [Mycoplasmataceae bacterium]|nr:hypothetical protein [Mycoplasmataceae bacterium]
MKQITGVRIEDKKVVLFEINRGAIIGREILFMKMMLEAEQFHIAKDGKLIPLKFNDEGTKIVEPPLDIFEKINFL